MRSRYHKTLMGQTFSQLDTLAVNNSVTFAQ